MIQKCEGTVLQSFQVLYEENRKNGRVENRIDRLGIDVFSLEAKH